MKRLPSAVTEMTEKNIIGQLESFLSVKTKVKNEGLMSKRVYPVNQ